MKKALVGGLVALGIAGAGLRTPANAASAEVTVDSTVGWQSAALDLRSGQSFGVEYRSGTWTVDYRNFAQVGIGGYDAAADQKIYQECKVLTDQTYGHLLARVGDGAPFVIAQSGTFTAPVAGRLEFRINDDDQCLADNAGSVVLRVTADGSTGPTAGPTPGPTTRPTNGSTLYSADWSSGLNGWAADSSWKTLRGSLLTDGSGSLSTVFAPYDTRGLADYAVEARIRVISLGKFGIVLRHSANEAGYIGVVSAPGSWQNNGSAWLGIGSDPAADGVGSGKTFDPGSGWHTYRIEADGNTLRFLIDGAPYAAATDNRTLSGDIAGLSCDHSQLEVSGFSVLRLH